jgi:hypothetical protein
MPALTESDTRTDPWTGYLPYARSAQLANAYENKTSAQTREFDGSNILAPASIKEQRSLLSKAEDLIEIRTQLWFERIDSLFFIGLTNPDILTRTTCDDAHYLIDSGMINNYSSPAASRYLRASDKKLFMNQFPVAFIFLSTVFRNEYIDYLCDCLNILHADLKIRVNTALVTHQVVSAMRDTYMRNGVYEKSGALHDETYLAWVLKYLCQQTTPPILLRQARRNQGKSLITPSNEQGVPAPLYKIEPTSNRGSLTMRRPENMTSKKLLNARHEALSKLYSINRHDT